MKCEACKYEIIDDIKLLQDPFESIIPHVWSNGAQVAVVMVNEATGKNVDIFACPKCGTLKIG